MAYLSQALPELRRNAVLSGLRWLPNSWQAKAWEPARTRHFGMDAEIQRPRTVIYALGQHLNQATA